MGEGDEVEFSVHEDGTVTAFETLPRFERDWRSLTAQQRATFRKVVTDAFCA